MLRLSLIERYVFRKALLATLGATVGLVAVIWVVRAVQESQLVLSQGQSFITYVKMISLGVPTLTAAIIPLALLIGLVRTVNGLNEGSELVVIHASGASRVSLMRPFLAVSLSMAILVLALHTWAGPTSMATLRDYITKVRTDLVAIVVREGTFNDVDGGLTFHISGRAPGGLLKGVFINDARDDDEIQTYLAQDGVISKVGDNAFLILQNGQIQRQSRTNPNVTTINFDSYAFDLTNYDNGGGSGRSQMEVSTYDLLFPSPDDKLYQHAPRRFVAELNVRATGWLHALAVGFLVLAFLGDPISHRQGQTVLVAACCAAALLVRGLSIVAETMARDSDVAIAIMWALPVGAIIVSAVLLALDMKALPDSLVTRVEALTGAIGAKASAILRRTGKAERNAGSVA